MSSESGRIAALEHDSSGSYCRQRGWNVVLPLRLSRRATVDRDSSGSVRDGVEAVELCCIAMSTCGNPQWLS